MSVGIFEPTHTASLELPDSRLLQLTRPSYKTKFVKYGDEVHLLVFLNESHHIPFVRVPVDTLYHSSVEYLKDNEVH